MKTSIASLAILGVFSISSAVTMAAVMAQSAPSNQQLAKEIAALKQEIATLKQAQHQRSNVLTTRPVTKPQLPPKTNNSSIAHHMANHNSIFGSLVVTGPSVGMPSHYNGSDLIVNSSSINEDYKLLQRSYLERHALTQRGYELLYYPHVVLSGKIEGEAIYNRPYQGSASSDIDLSAAELDAYIEMTPWVNGLLTIAYDHKPANDSPSLDSASPGRIGNSRLFISKGFITFGNVEKSPFYGSIGQMYLPFGRYSSANISDPLTKVLGRTKVRAINLGFRLNRDNSPYGEVYAFRGETQSDNTSRANQYGADVGYQFATNGFTGEIGASYISTIADSGGMLNNGQNNTHFSGFDSNSDHVLVHRVPALDIHGHIGYGLFHLIGEYVTATSDFSARDLQYQHHGAHPRAAALEGDIAFDAFNKPMTLGLSYSYSKQALALNMPKARYVASLTTAIYRNTLLEFEYRHDKDYGKNVTANGGEGHSAVTGSGKSSNTVTAAVDIYF